MEDGPVRTSVKKWGNSAAVRIPAAVMKAVRLSLNQSVNVREDSGRIVFEPVRTPEYDLSKLVKGITRANRYEEESFGRPVGREAW
jgi:antitoxin MazE